MDASTVRVLGHRHKLVSRSRIGEAQLGEKPSLGLLDTNSERPLPTALAPHTRAAWSPQFLQPPATVSGKAAEDSQVLGDLGEVPGSWLLPSLYQSWGN